MSVHGDFFWNEIMTRDVEATKKFYADSLGWTYSSMDMGPGGTYWIINNGETSIGGIVDMVGEAFEGMSEHWMSYVCVDDIDARIEKARAAGAVINSGPFDVPEVGRMAILQQPGGAVIAWMTPASQSG